MMKKFLMVALMMLPLSIFAQKFGHINSMDIMQAMPEYTAAQNELQQLQTQYENELKRMQDELKKKSDEYDKEKDNLLDNVKARREAELQDLYTRIQQSYQDNQKSLQETSQQKMQQISEKMLEAIKKVGDEGGYVYIMDVTAGTPYISTTLSNDVTAIVKQKLGLK